jgi:hypothetical protein
MAEVTTFRKSMLLITNSIDFDVQGAKVFFIQLTISNFASSL